MLPNGTLNFALAAIILTLRLTLLVGVRRVRSMPCFAVYLAVNCVTTGAFLLGAASVRVAWEVPVALAAMLAAVEAGDIALWGHGPEERANVYRWAFNLALVLCGVAWAIGPPPYPGYPSLVYYTRLYFGILAIGWLAGVLRYCGGELVGQRLAVIHCGLLLLRIAAETGALTVHDRTSAVWFAADAWSKGAVVLTLIGWLWLLPRRSHAILVK